MLVPAGAVPVTLAVSEEESGALPELGDALKLTLILCGVTVTVCGAEEEFSPILFEQVTVYEVVEFGVIEAEPLVWPPVLKLVPLEVVESAQVQRKVVDSPWIMEELFTVKLETLGLLDIVTELEGAQLMFETPGELMVTVPVFVPVLVYDFVTEDVLPLSPLVPDQE